MHCGGAAGYCPRVQKVTSYSSTSLVYFRKSSGLEYRQKYQELFAVKFPSMTLLPVIEVSDKYITLRAAMSPAGRETLV